MKLLVLKDTDPWESNEPRIIEKYNRSTKNELSKDDNIFGGDFVHIEIHQNHPKQHHMLKLLYLRVPASKCDVFRLVERTFVTDIGWHRF